MMAANLMSGNGHRVALGRYARMYHAASSRSNSE